MKLDRSKTQSALEQLADSLRTHLQSKAITCPVMLGIHTGGAWVAKWLQQHGDDEMPLGTLDISFYRDDFSQIGIHPEVRSSQIPFDIDNRHIVLVDDVLYTGRTIRAALNEIFDYGRPASVTLAVLVERNGRQLPIVADCVGLTMPLLENQQIKLSNEALLELEVIDIL